MKAKLVATEGSTETGLVRFTFESTFKEAAELGKISCDDEVFIVKADKYIGTLHGWVEEVESPEEKTVACFSNEVFQVFAGKTKGEKVELICIASE